MLFIKKEKSYQDFVGIAHFAPSNIFRGVWVTKPFILACSNRVCNEYLSPKGLFSCPLFNYGNKIISIHT